MWRDAGAAYFIAVSTDTPAPERWPWQVDLMDHVGSTNDEVIARAAAGAAPGLVVATADQRSGHGRLGRTWVSPPGSGLALSALVPLPRSHPELVPLAAGLAAAAVVHAAGVPASVKWPNDVLVTQRGLKVGGVLCRAVDEAAVVGIGLNVVLEPDELPTPHATALSLHGVQVAATELVQPVLRELRGRIELLLQGRSADLLEEYRRRCSTLGALVRVEMPHELIVGRAVDVTNDGCLLVDDGGTVHTVTAGDVVHVRPAGD